MFKSFAALVLSLALLPLSAQATDPAAPAAPDEPAAPAAPEATAPVVDFGGFSGLPYQQVAVEISRPGESLDAFVVRVAPIFDAFTAEHEWEACGRLAQDDTGRYALVVGTIQAALSCATSSQNVPAGFTAMEQSVHSHPRTKTVHPTPSDLALQRMAGIRGLPYKDVERNPSAKGFSVVDFDAGAGYLVAAGRVFHQQGRRTVREVGRLAQMAPIRHFPKR